MNRTRRAFAIAAVSLSVLWTAHPGAESSRPPRDTTEELNILVMGDLDHVVLTDPRGRSNRDSSGYLVSGIPDCIRDDVTQDRGDAAADRSARMPAAMMLALSHPEPGVYRLAGRTRARTSVQIHATHFCPNGDQSADHWEGPVQGAVAWRIVVGGESDSCLASVRKLPPLHRRKPAPR